MNNNLEKNWIEYLNSQNSNKSFSNWEKFSKRFGKKRLLELFEEGNKYMYKSNNFKKTFVFKIVNELRKDRDVKFFDTKKTYSPLMSLFSKFRYFYKEYQENLGENFSCVSKEMADNKKQTKEDLLNSFKDQYYGELASKFGKNFFHIIDTYVKKNMDPKINSNLYLAKSDAIKKFGQKIGKEISEQDDELIKRFIQGRYDKDGNIIDS